VLFFKHVAFLRKENRSQNRAGSTEKLHAKNVTLLVEKFLTAGHINANDVNSAVVTIAPFRKVDYREKSILLTR